MIVVMVLTLAAHGCKDLSSNPTDTTRTLIESSFEFQNQPSLSGWEDGYPMYAVKKARYSFDSDVPPGGGQWSLRLQPPDTNATAMRFSVRPEQPSQYSNFRLTYWVKDKYSLGSYAVTLSAWMGSYSYGCAFRRSRSSEWEQDTVTYTSLNRTVDSLVVFVAMYFPYSKSDTSKYIWFDRFKIDQF